MEPNPLKRAVSEVFSEAVKQRQDPYSSVASGFLGVPYEMFVAALQDHSHPLHEEYACRRRWIKELTSLARYKYPGN